MKIALIALVVFSALGNVVSAAGRPEEAFGNYLATLANAKRPEALLPYLSEDKRVRQQEISMSAAMRELEFFQEMAVHFEVLYRESELHGKRATLRWEGIDRAAEAPARWEVTMVLEPDGWKFHDMRVAVDKDTIKKEMRVWKLGKDETPVEGMLRGHDKRAIYLLLKDMRTVEIPLESLSEEDLKYLIRDEENTEARLQRERERLFAKARAQSAQQ